MKNSKWRITEIDQTLVNDIKKKFGLKEPIIKTLLLRGVGDLYDIDDFLNPQLTRLPEPNQLKDLKKGAHRVVDAIFKKEKIAVYGDYDADGITACALVYLFLKKLGADVCYYIPDRFEDGYSLNKKALDELKNKDVSLVVTVDCGVSDVELVEYGNSIGLEFVITDHHNVPDVLPNAYAIINPKRKDCTFPFKEMAGVGVAFYLIIKLRKILREKGFFSYIEEPNLKSYLDLVAVGTVSDMVPLMGPNRIFVKYGLQEIKKSGRIGLKALMAELNVNNIDTRLISFRITPRLNAPGRMSSPKHAFELLVCSSEDRAKELVKTLNSENQRRQKEEEKVLQGAIRMIEEMEERFVYLLYSPDWHPGVLGIVASKLVERFHKPVFLFTDEDETLLRGSGRSVEGFSITECLNLLCDYLAEFGGHDLACGVSLRREDFRQFSDELNHIAKNLFINNEICRQHTIDALLEPSDIDDVFFEQLSLLEPFGKANPEPLFLIDNVIVEKTRPVGQKENHIKLVLKKGNQMFNSIGFFMFTDSLKEQSKIDIVGLPKLNMYNGIKSWDFFLKDFCILD